MEIPATGAVQVMAAVAVIEFDHDVVDRPPVHANFPLAETVLFAGCIDVLVTRVKTYVVVETISVQ